MVQILEHFLTDVAREEVAVRPSRLERASFRKRNLAHCTHKDVFVNAVEVYVATGDGLHAERHDDEAYFRKVACHWLPVPFVALPRAGADQQCSANLMCAPPAKHTNIHLLAKTSGDTLR